MTQEEKDRIDYEIERKIELWNRNVVGWVFAISLFASILFVFKLIFEHFYYA